MKKLIALLLVLVMAVSMVACADNTPTDPSTNAPTNPVEPEEKTLGEYMAEKFVEIKTANPDMPAEEIIYGILDSNVGMALMSLGLNLGAVPVEPGMLTGFGTEAEPFEVTGFASGTMFLPMIGSVPFIGYAFDLADASGVEAFAASLEQNANPGWNICVIAEDVTVETCGNSVFIVMCQKEAPGLLTGKIAKIEPQDMTASETAVWNSLNDVLASSYNPMIMAGEIADAMVANGVAGEAAAVMDIISNDQFLYEIDSYNAATITDGDKVVYIFVLDTGVDAQTWAEYYCSAKDGTKIIWGAYEAVVLAMVNFD